MALWTLALVMGALGGLACGGSLKNLAATRFRALPLLVLAVTLEAVLGLAPGAARGLLAAVACTAVAGWCVSNGLRHPLRSAGQYLTGLGVMLNGLVIGLNAGMPVSRAALQAAGLPKMMDPSRGDLYKHTVMSGHTRLGLLGDVVPFHVFHTVLSAGDLVMLAGLAALAWTATKASGPVGKVRLANLASRASLGAVAPDGA